MLVTTLRRDLERAHSATEIDHRARHLANAREWLKREREAREGKAPEGTDPEAIHESFLRECKSGNIDPETVLPAA